MRRLLLNTSIITLVLLSGGCSTFFNTPTEVVELNTIPPNAKITIDGNKFGTTPQYVNLERGTNHVIRFELDGYESYEIQITRRVSYWFWLNILNGFIPGMVTDSFTGAMYNLMPDEIEAELTPVKVQEPVKKGKK